MYKFDVVIDWLQNNKAIYENINTLIWLCMYDKHIAIFTFQTHILSSYFITH